MVTLQSWFKTYPARELRPRCGRNGTIERCALRWNRAVGAAVPTVSTLLPRRGSLRISLERRRIDVFGRDPKTATCRYGQKGCGAAFVVTLGPPAIAQTPDRRFLADAFRLRDGAVAAGDPPIGVLLALGEAIAGPGRSRVTSNRNSDYLPTGSLFGTHRGVSEGWF
jgi:hypothetical protein